MSDEVAAFSEEYLQSQNNRIDFVFTTNSLEYAARFPLIINDADIVLPLKTKTSRL